MMSQQYIYFLPSTASSYIKVVQIIIVIMQASGTNGCVRPISIDDGPFLQYVDPIKLHFCTTVAHIF